MRELKQNAPPRADPLAARIAKVCDAVGDFVEYWGFKAIHGRIWALLALRAAPTQQADIARTLNVSRALISSAIAELTERGLVRPISSQRNAPYEAVLDVWPVIADVLRSREWMLLEAARLSLAAALEQAEITDRRDGHTHGYSIARLQFLLTMTELAQGLLKTLMALRVPTAMDNLRTWGRRAAAFIQGTLR